MKITSKKRKILSSFLLVLFLLVVEACDSPKPSGLRSSKDAVVCDEDKNEKINEEAVVALSLATPEEGTYQGGAKLIIDETCAKSGCHAAGDTDPNLSTYIGAKAEGIEIIERTDGTTSHKNVGTLDAAKLDILSAWKAGGYLDTLPPVEEEEESTTEGEAPTFDTVLQIIGTPCNGCHSTDSASGKIILDTKAEFDKNGNKVVTIVGGEHKGKIINSDDQDVISKYVASLTGTKNSGDDTGAKDTNGDTKTSPNAEECSVPKDDDTKTTTGDESKFSDVLKPQAMKDCHAEEVPKMYDRKEKACHEATLGGSYECNWDGVTAKFSNVEGAEEEIKKLIDTKWQVDQCGILAGKPFVFLVKATVDGQQLNLDIKTLGTTIDDE